MSSASGADGGRCCKASGVRTADVTVSIMHEIWRHIIKPDSICRRVYLLQEQSGRLLAYCNSTWNEGALDLFEDDDDDDDDGRITIVS